MLFYLNIICDMEQEYRKLFKILGNYLKSLREQRGISLNIFAYENDMTTATVSRIENGLVDTKLSTLIKYAKGLEVPLENILISLEINYTNDKD